MPCSSNQSQSCFAPSLPWTVILCSRLQRRMHSTMMRSPPLKEIGGGTVVLAIQWMCMVGSTFHGPDDSAPQIRRRHIVVINEQHETLGSPGLETTFPQESAEVLLVVLAVVGADHGLA